MHKTHKFKKKNFRKTKLFYFTMIRLETFSRSKVAYILENIVCLLSACKLQATIHQEHPEKLYLSVLLQAYPKYCFVLLSAQLAPCFLTYQHSWHPVSCPSLRTIHILFSLELETVFWNSFICCFQSHTLKSLIPSTLFNFSSTSFLRICLIDPVLFQQHF